MKKLVGLLHILVLLPIPLYAFSINWDRLPSGWEETNHGDTVTWDGSGPPVPITGDIHGVGFFGFIAGSGSGPGFNQVKSHMDITITNPNSTLFSNNMFNNPQFITNQSQININFTNPQPSSPFTLTFTSP